MIEVQPEDLLPANFSDVLLDLLHAHPQGLGEHHLLQLLAQRWPESLFAEPGALRDPLQLFRLHFLLFNRLYLLADQLAPAHLALDIHVLKIVLRTREAGADAIELADPLRRYYLDWAQWRQTNADDVQRLLDSFWQGRGAVADGEVDEALAVMEFTEAPTPAALKRRYRSLLSRHHPDRGGSTVRAQEINRAMLILQRYYGKT
ncbi:DNA-J related domain-containing protein [Halopseudomonas maritima]|uniref:DNA-J related domain-containing protein n=1 Tax=Halopseudomonas maritima TaxID=2918528 RepID=UPI001EEBC185|nr:DNA-J related domain-containing protein [Halopseudomonas maritima]UJJ31190.1 molecular chaperone DnaJ [Halopseudomonas maritima]